MDRRSFVLFAVVALCLSAARPSGAVLTNGDFWSGFTGWSGEVTDVSYTTTPVFTLPGAYTGNYAITGGNAVVTTTDDYWSVMLYQAFTVDALTDPLNSLLLSYSVSPTLLGDQSPFPDGIFAQLNYNWDSIGGSWINTLDLLGATSRDITFLAGQAVELLFGVDDYNQVTGDTLTVGPVGIQQIPVPEPGSLLLVGSGLLGFAAMRRRTRR